MFLPCLPMTAYCTHLHYWPACQWLAPLASGKTLILEAHDHYQKKSGRNRTTILSSYGPTKLSVPLLKGKHQQMPYQDVQIAWDAPWNRTHWRTIRSCYGRAPFYEHFEDDLAVLYERKDVFLWDWNLALFHWLLHQMQLPEDFNFTASWKTVLDSDTLDLRQIDMDKVTDHILSQTPYPQVFADRHGFTPGLSALDLLFCAGPQARMILRKMNRIEPE